MTTSIRNEALLKYKKNIWKTEVEKKQDLTENQEFKNNHETFKHKYHYVLAIIIATENSTFLPKYRRPF